MQIGHSLGTIFAILSFDYSFFHQNQNNSLYTFFFKIKYPANGKLLSIKKYTIVGRILLSFSIRALRNTLDELFFEFF
jgi:hypothetical protein